MCRGGYVRRYVRRCVGVCQEVCQEVYFRGVGV